MTKYSIWGEGLFNNSETGGESAIKKGPFDRRISWLQNNQFLNRPVSAERRQEGAPIGYGFEKELQQCL